MRTLHLHNLGLISYADALALQEEIHGRMVAGRQNGLPMPFDTLFLCQHTPTITLGKSGKASNLLIDAAILEEKGIVFTPSSRGGDITYHGPGQLVAYPIIDLNFYFTDIHRYLRLLEEAVIEVLLAYGIVAGRIEGFTGVWVGQEKICAMGIRASRWVVMHGLALNVDPDLAHFEYIIPCNIADKGVTSMARLLGQAPGMEEVEALLSITLARLLGAHLELESVA
jgi:lipoyl(octanoyl) transferase